MINIIICDDDNLFLNTLENKLRSYFKSKKDIPCRITRYDSIESLLQSNITQTDIIVLDVRFKSMNGIEAAAILRKLSLHFILIFISGFIEYAPAGYKVNASRYILKEQLDIFFEEAIDEALFQLGYQRNFISLKFIGYECNETIYTDSILFIESRLHEVHFNFTNGDSSYLYDTLNAIQSKLPSDEFIRIHQSYLVNLKYFLDARNYHAVLCGDFKLPISQKLFSKVKKQLFLYRGKL